MRVLACIATSGTPSRSRPAQHCGRNQHEDDAESTTWSGCAVGPGPCWSVAPMRTAGGSGRTPPPARWRSSIRRDGPQTKALFDVLRRPAPDFQQVGTGVWRYIGNVRT